MTINRVGAYVNLFREAAHENFYGEAPVLRNLEESMIFQVSERNRGIAAEFFANASRKCKIGR